MADNSTSTNGSMTPSLAELLLVKADRLQVMVRELGASHPASNLVKRARLLGNSSNLTRLGCLRALCEHYGIQCDPSTFGKKANDKLAADTVTGVASKRIQVVEGHAIPQVTADPVTGALVAHEPVYQKYRPVTVTELDVLRIWHISDIHLYSDQHEWKWDRYRKVLDNTVEAIREDGVRTGDICIISGDIFHKPTAPNSNLLVIFDRFIRALSTLFRRVSNGYGTVEARDRIIIISGNHDINEAWVNPDSARVETLRGLGETHREFFRYVRDNEVLRYGQTLISVSSLFSDATVRHQDIDLCNRPENKRDITKYRTVAVAHCDLLGDRFGTAQKMSFSSRHRSIEEFRGYDALLLGDIHQEQEVSAENPVAYYPGSLIQTNLGETVGDHGILLWDVSGPGEDVVRLIPKPEFIEIPDEYALVRVTVTDGEYEPPALPACVRNIVVQFENNGTTAERLRQVREELSAQWTIVGSSEGRHAAEVPDSLATGKDPTKQKVREEFRHEDPRIMDLHQTISARATQETDHQSLNWTIRRLVIDRLFNHYHSEIDFTTHSGILAVQGLNASGKTNLINALYMAFGVNTVDLNRSIMNGYQTASIICDITIGAESATISREYRLLKPRRGATQASTGRASCEQSNCVITFHNKEPGSTGLGSQPSQLRSRSSAAEYIKDNLNQIWFALNRISGLSLLDMSPMARSVFLSEVFGFSHMVETVQYAKEHLRSRNQDRTTATEAHSRLRLEEPVVLPEDPADQLEAARSRMDILVAECRGLQGGQITAEEARLMEESRKDGVEIPEDVASQLRDAETELDRVKPLAAPPPEYDNLRRRLAAIRQKMGTLLDSVEPLDDGREITEVPEAVRGAEQQERLLLESYRKKQMEIEKRLPGLLPMRRSVGEVEPAAADDAGRFDLDAYRKVAHELSSLGLRGTELEEADLKREECVTRLIPATIVRKSAVPDMIRTQESLRTQIETLRSFDPAELRGAVEARDLDRLVAVAEHILDLGLDRIGKLYEKNARVTAYFAEMESHNQLHAERVVEIEEVHAHNTRVQQNLDWYRRGDLEGRAYVQERLARREELELREELRVTIARREASESRVAELGRIIDILAVRDYQRLRAQVDSITQGLESHRENLRELQTRVASLQKQVRIRDIGRRLEILNRKSQVDRALTEASAEHARLRQASAEYNRLRGRAEVVEENRRVYQESAARLSQAEEAHALAMVYYTEINRLQIQYTLDKCEEVCNYANTIMEQCQVPFRCQMTAQKKSVELSFLGGTDSGMCVQYTSLSGYQQFVANICLVTAVNRSTVRNRLDFLVIDEGFGAIDQNNIQNLGVIFQVLRNEFRNVVVISHVNNIEDYADWNLKIVNRDGVSSVR